jgi:hypothetical protein
MRPVAGKVGHDRIQQGKAGESIGEAIRWWRRLRCGDFERIDVDVATREDVLDLTPLGCKLAGKTRSYELKRPGCPLSFTKSYASEL